MAKYLKGMNLFLFLCLILRLEILHGFTEDQLRGQSADLQTAHVYSGLEGPNMLMPDDALRANPANLYSFTMNLVPSGRVKHVLVYREPFAIVLGGYAIDGTFLDDVQMYDSRSRRWSGIVLKRECCNVHGQVIETSGIQESSGKASRPEVKEPIPSTFTRGSKLGLHGDLPIARAEHAGTEANGLVYIFGGVTEKFSYSQDFYSFDPIDIHWRVFDKYAGLTPPRRAGHTITTDHSSNGKVLWLFGGRSVVGKVLTGLNDVWSFDTGREVWNCASCALSRAGGQTSPIGRQYHAAAMANGFLVITGGIDPSSNTTFNDIWAFHTGLKTWQQLSANSGSTGGFAPPPLIHATLLSLTKPSTAPNSIGQISNGFILYGGVSGGGACGGHHCHILETTLGQVYRLKLVFSRNTPAIREGASIIDSAYDTESMSLITASPIWEYARLTGASYDRGRLLKTYAMESACYDQSRGLMYIMGGMRAQSVKLSTADQVALDISGSAYLDAGESFPVRLWDTHTGEHLRQTNQAPVNGPWTFENGFTRFQPLLNNSIEFLQTFRAFSVRDVDIVEQFVDEKV